MSQKKKPLFAGAAAIFLYFMVLPFFWPSPAAKVSMAKEAPFDQDLEITVVVRTWHSNFLIDQVRFYVDRSTTTAHGPGGPFYPIVLYNNPERIHAWPFWLNRLTWPRSQVLTLILPLKSLSQEQVVKQGIVRGKLNVTISFPMPPEPLALLLGYSAMTQALDFPFELRLT